MCRRLPQSIKKRLKSRFKIFLRTGRASLAQLPRNRDIIHAHFSSSTHLFFSVFQDCFVFLNLTSAIPNGGRQVVAIGVIFCIYCGGHVLARSGSAAEINNQQLSAGI